MKTPCLTAAIADDDDALAVAVNELLMRSKTIRRLSNRIRRAQERLQEVVDRRAWERYLRLEEIINDRTNRESDLIIRWAFEAGKRHGVSLGVQLVSCPEAAP
jgi:predicted  nucleic acid-binding Zn-ribbon protein